MKKLSSTALLAALQSLLLLQPAHGLKHGLRATTGESDGNDNNNAVDVRSLVVSHANDGAVVSAAANDRSLLNPALNLDCMEQASGISLGCTAQDIKFSRVRDFDIIGGPSLKPCNCTTYAVNQYSLPTCGTAYDVDCGNFVSGTVFGACDGGNGIGSVTVQMNVDFLVNTKRYDIGMYIATDGGSVSSIENDTVTPHQPLYFYHISH